MSFLQHDELVEVYNNIPYYRSYVDDNDLGSVPGDNLSSCGGRTQAATHLQ